MATQGPNSPATLANVAFSGAAWTNTSNAGASDNAYATVPVFGGFGQTDILRCTNFGFSIPAGATINGITIDIEGVSTGSDAYYVVQPVKAGAATGSSSFPAIPTSEGYVSVGSGSSLLGASWSDSDINDTGFGVEFKCYNENASDRNISVDHVRITITYTPASAGHPAMRRWGGTPGMLGAGRIGRSW